MVGALLHKEYREHRSIWLALAAVAAAVLLGVPSVFSAEMHPRSSLPDLLHATALLLAWIDGVVCGAMLLAGEAEGGTQVFLDALPSSRLSVWRGKFLVGGLLVLLHLAFLVVLLGVQGLSWRDQGLAVTVAALGYSGLAGFVWGLFFSARARNVLVAIGLAVLAQLTLVPLLAGPLLLLASHLVEYHHQPAALVVTTAVLAVVLILAPLAMSALLYAHTDRDRPVWYTVGRVVRKKISEADIFWMFWRQERAMLGVLSLFCLAAGSLVLANGLVLWPLVTLAVGVYCGVAVFLDEQSGAFRFLGDQRFPLGRLWAVKMLLWSGVLFLAVGIASVPSVLRAAHLAHDRNNGNAFFDHLFGLGFLGEAIPLWLFLFLFPVYGFAAGCLCGVLFRKLLVALAAGLAVAAILVGVWIPSLLAGGLHGWQIIGPVVVVLVCSRRLMRSWASDRLRSWETVCVLSAAVLLCAALTTLGLWWRVAVIPDVPEPDDFAAFLASLPEEENQAGPLICSACSRLVDLRDQWRRDHPWRVI